MNQQLCPLLSHCGKQAFGHICTPPLLTGADSASFKGMYSTGFLLLSSQHLWCFTVFIDLSCVCVGRACHSGHVEVWGLVGVSSPLPPCSPGTRTQVVRFDGKYLTYQAISPDPYSIFLKLLVLLIIFLACQQVFNRIIWDFSYLLLLTNFFLFNFPHWQIWAPNQSHKVSRFNQ